MVFIAMVASFAACEVTPPAPRPNPLDALDPDRSGPFSPSLAYTSGLLAQANKAALLDPDRLLSARDPLAIQAALADAGWELGDKDGAGSLTQGTVDRLEVYRTSAKGLALVLARAFQALDRWAAIGTAQVALRVANLLDGAGELDAGARAELVAAGEQLAQAGAVETLDWSVELPFEVMGTSAGKAIQAHAPMVLPSAEAAQRAEAFTSLLLAAVHKKSGDQLPFHDGTTARPDSGTRAAQTVLKLPLLEGYVKRAQAVPSPVVAIAAYPTAVDVAVASALGATLTVEQQDATAGALVTLELLAEWLRRAANSPSYVAVDVPPAVMPTCAGELEDCDARRFVPNVGDPQAATYLTLNFAEPPATRGNLETDPLPVNGFSWSLGPRPLDHVDVRVEQWNGTTPFEIRHHVLRPRGDGQIATGTLFRPTREEYLRQTVRYVVTTVDVLGQARRGTGLATTYSAGVNVFRVGVPPSFPVEISIFADAGVDMSGPADEIVILPSRLGEQRRARLRASLQTLARGRTTRITVANQDDVLHRYAAVYTPPYVELPFRVDLDANRVGGQILLDLGMVPARSQIFADLTVPADAPLDYEWHFFDFLGRPGTPQQHFDVRVIAP